MIVVAGNLGLGDHIITAGLVAKIAIENNDRIIVPCWQHNLSSVESFYVNHRNVECIATDAEISNLDLEGAIKTGVYNVEMPRLEGESIPEWFYRQAGISYIDRFKYCPIAKASVSYNGRPNYPKWQFLHQKDSNTVNGDYLNENLPIVQPVYANSILSNSIAIQDANEIHCIDSSFLHLVESLPTKGKLFYHKYARFPYEDFKFYKDWTVIN